MWMRIDDGLHAHRKTRTVTKSHEDKRRDCAPMGLWVLAGAWAAQNGTDGWVPEDELDRWDDDWRPLATRLVRAGYWWPHERNGERYGVSNATVYKYARAAGIRRKTRGARPEIPCQSCGRTCRSMYGICWTCKIATSHQEPQRARSEDHVALTGGRWVPRGGIQVWEAA